MIGDIEIAQKASAATIRARLMNAKAPTLRERVLGIRRRITRAAEPKVLEYKRLEFTVTDDMEDAKAASSKAAEVAADTAIIAADAAREYAVAADKLATLALAASAPRMNQQLRWRQIIAEVAKQHQISVNDMLSHGRTRPLTEARQVMWYRLRTETTLSLAEIGRRIGFDHSSGVNALNGYAKRTGLRP